MALPMTPIFTQTVGAGGAASIAFNNIPQQFTDLKLIFSIRSTTNGNPPNPVGIFFNGSQALMSFRHLGGNGGSAYGDSGGSGSTFGGIAEPTSYTANTFSSHELYVPNYTSANFKQCTIDSVTENNATTSYLSLVALLCRDTNPITSLGFYIGNSLTIGQYSTATLYGIIRPGA